MGADCFAASFLISSSLSCDLYVLLGRALTEVAKAQKKIGELWSTAQESIDEGLVSPFKLFLNCELKQTLV